MLGHSKLESTVRYLGIHVVKPIDMDELAAAICRHVRDRDQRAAADADSA